MKKELMCGYGFLVLRLFKEMRLPLFEVMSALDIEDALKVARIVRAIVFALAQRAKVEEVRPILEKQGILDEECIDIILEDIEDSSKRCSEMDAKVEDSGNGNNKLRRIQSAIAAIKFAEMMRQISGDELLNKFAQQRFNDFDDD